MRAFVCKMAAGALVLVATPSEARDVTLAIPPGPLGRAIVDLGRQSGVSIALADPTLAPVRVRGVRGRMSPAEGLARLLGDTPASFVQVDSSSFRVIRRQLTAVSVQPQPRRVDPPDRSEPSLAPIIITAAKRAQDIRNYAGPITVLQSDELAQSAGVDGTAGISARVPGLGSTHLGPGRNKLFIRGVADSSFNGPTQATVGQYFGEARLNYNSPDPDLRLYDLRAVELLPGPQGTLYGAGSIGGVLRFTPNAPDPTAPSAGVTASASATRFGGLGAELAAFGNLPLIEDKAALRAVAYGIREGGYIDDVGRGKQDINDTTIGGGRVTLRVKNPDGWTVDVSAIGQAINGSDGQYAERREGRLARRSAIAQPFSSRFALFNLTAQRTGGTIDVITTLTQSYHRLTEFFDASPVVETPSALRQRNRSTMTAWETRISHSQQQGISWLAGTAVVFNHARFERQLGPPGLLEPRPGVANNIAEQTIFGELTKTAGRIGLTGGARVSRVVYRGHAIDPRPGMNADTTRGQQWRVLPSVALNFRPTSATQLYARFQQGFRPGGAVLRDDATQRIKSDRISALEAGFRFGELAGAKVGGALSFSRSRWTNVQADLLGVDGLQTTTNLGNGVVRSIDARLKWQISDRLKADASAVLNRSRVKNALAGIILDPEAPLPNVPNIVARAGLEYVQSLGARHDLHLSTWARYVGKSTLGIGPVLGRTQGKYVDSALDIRLRTPRNEFFATVTNLMDVRGDRFALGSIPGFNTQDQTTPLRPRTIRVGISTSF